MTPLIDIVLSDSCQSTIVNLGYYEYLGRDCCFIDFSGSAGVEKSCGGHEDTTGTE